MELTRGQRLHRREHQRAPLVGRRDDSSGRPAGRVGEVPFSSEKELVMDILRHGAEVEVLAPASLRREVRARVGAMLAIYS